MKELALTSKQVLPTPGAARVSIPFLQRKCACGGTPGPSGECEQCRKKRQGVMQQSVLDAKPMPSIPAFAQKGLRSPGNRNDTAAHDFVESRLGHDFGRLRIFAARPEPAHVDGSAEDDPVHAPLIEQFRQREGLPAGGIDEFGQRVGPSDAEIKYSGLGGSSGSSKQGTGTPTPTPASTPCPSTVSVGAIVQRNHGDQSAADKEVWRTSLGAMSRMDVGPGPDHSGHCMKERLTTVSNTCPAAVYTRGGATIEPCTGNRCLDINRGITSWGLSDGPTSFLDMHRTRAHDSLLEGTGVSSCSVICEQTYTCDRTRPTTGTFRITRNFQAGSHTRADGTTIHITTGTVTKT